MEAYSRAIMSPALVGFDPAVEWRTVDFSGARALPGVANGVLAARERLQSDCAAIA